MFWGGPDRRKSVRVQIRMTVHVEVAGQPRFYEAVSRDLSFSGARLILRHELKHCTPIYLEFRLPGTLATLYSPAHVAWAKDTMTSVLPGQGSSCLMGIEFVRPTRKVRKELKRFIVERSKTSRKGS